MGDAASHEVAGLDRDRRIDPAVGVLVVQPLDDQGAGDVDAFAGAGVAA